MASPRSLESVMQRCAEQISIDQVQVTRLTDIFLTSKFNLPRLAPGISNFEQVRFNSLLQRCLQDKGWTLDRRSHASQKTQGGYGSLFFVERSKDGQSTDAVVKRQWIWHGERMRSSFRELIVLKDVRKFDHPNIIRLLDTAVINQRSAEHGCRELWLMLEAMPSNLTEANKKNNADRKWPPLDFHATVTHGCLQGVSFLHKRRVLHRDIKPDNVLVDDREPELRGLRVKLCDFGLSRLLQSTDRNDAIAEHRDSICSMHDVPQPEIVQRGYTTQVVTALWRAPELMGCANINIMTEEQLMTFDTYAIGLLWAGGLAKMSSPVGIKTDGVDVQKQQERLRQIFKNVDRPKEGIMKELRYKEPYLGLEQAELSDLGVRQWLEKKWSGGEGDKEKLRLCSEAIYRAVRFDYRERASADELLQLPCFDEQRAWLEELGPRSALESPPADVDCDFHADEGYDPRDDLRVFETQMRSACKKQDRAELRGLVAQQERYLQCFLHSKKCVDEYTDEPSCLGGISHFFIRNFAWCQ